MGSRQMITLSSLIHTFEADLLTQYGSRLLPGHFRALNAMKQCRTHLSPQMQLQCTQCDQTRLVPHSCGHRLCPHCQHHESQQWIERQTQQLVPGTYFLLTFTLPAELRHLAWQHQRLLYDAMMQCSWNTLRTFARNDKQLHGTAGAVAVLHTHSRPLDFHPHVHVVMPAAAINLKQRLWRTKRRKTKKNKPYLFNAKALAKVFRAKLLEHLKHARLTLPDRYPTRWVVHCKAVGSGAKALIYLGRYLYRGVIREKDILACNNGRVTFRYLEGKSRRWRTRTEMGADFLWLILQHVLPKGWRRARNFGFLHHNSKPLIALLQLLLKLDLRRAATWIKPRPGLLCKCGAPMHIVRTRLQPASTVSTATADDAARAVAM